MGAFLCSIYLPLVYRQIVNEGRPGNYESPHGHRHGNGGRSTADRSTSQWGRHRFRILHFHLDRRLHFRWRRATRNRSRYLSHWWRLARRTNTGCWRGSCRNHRRLRSWDRPRICLGPHHTRRGYDDQDESENSYLFNHALILLSTIRYILGTLPFFLASRSNLTSSP